MVDWIARCESVSLTEEGDSGFKDESHHTFDFRWRATGRTLKVVSKLIHADMPVRIRQRKAYARRMKGEEDHWCQEQSRLKKQDAQLIGELCQLCPSETPLGQLLRP